jgi:hypothetical protein
VLISKSTKKSPTRICLDPEATGKIQLIFRAVEDICEKQFVLAIIGKEGKRDLIEIIASYN